MKKPLFTGACTALVTPFLENNVNYPMLEQLLRRQIDAGIHAVVICGTTGEAPTLSDAEKLELFKRAKAYVGSDCLIIAGTGSNSTKHTLELSLSAEKMNVDALLLVSPYYNKANPEGLYQHYETVARAVDLPIILYNVPSRTGVSCTAETYRALSSHPNIIGVKEASGNQNLIQKTIDLCPDDFYVWSGNDDETAATMLLGGTGVISVVSNVAPEMMLALTNACLAGNFSEAGKLQIKVRKLADVLFREVNPIPVKTALSVMGLCEEIFRLPLCRLNEAHRAELTETLEAYSLL